MSLHRLLGFRHAVADPGALASYYAELGLSGDASAGYAGSDGGAIVLVDEAPFRRLIAVDIGCDDDRDLEAVQQRLNARGAGCSRASESVSVLDSASRVLITVRVAEREAGTSLADFVAPNAPGAVARLNERAHGVFGAPRPPRRLGHLVIGTPDLRATRDLLVDGIGCKVSDEFEGVIHFLRCSTDHHNIGLVHSSVPILQHYSWECTDLDHLGHTATALYRADPSRHAWGIGRHFAGSNFYWYLRDPSGAFLELYSDLDRITDDEAWEQRGRTPMTLEHTINAWGPNLPPEFIEPHDLAELRAGWANLGS
ncbi:MAG: glyoxalase/bleomycin resistance protein/dioxygenase [Actinomycetia bacterium]|nr:glyoxalase/bleomycin resistance protein/dioxygenase [Actinomycetes bacterium]